jgi:hypothetical protein
MPTPAAGDRHNPVIPMGASKNPQFRYQSRASQLLKEICAGSKLSVAELASLLQSTTGKKISPAELEKWQAGGNDFPAWVVLAMADICGAQLKHSPWASRHRRSLSLVTALAGLVAGALLATAVMAHFSGLPLAARHQVAQASLIDSPIAASSMPPVRITAPPLPTTPSKPPAQAPQVDPSTPVPLPSPSAVSDPPVPTETPRPRPSSPTPKPPTPKPPTPTPAPSPSPSDGPDN